MKKIVWQNTEQMGLEFLFVKEGSIGINIESTVIQTDQDASFCLEYAVTLSKDWEMRGIDFKEKGTERYLTLSTNGKGKWFDENGQTIQALEGAKDIDLSCTPFTNTLPINRNKWQINEPIDLEVVYIDRNMNYRKRNQRYTLVEEEEQRKFQYQSGSFTTIFTVDSFGFITNYPGFFKQLYHQEGEGDL
ncbi:hypothetical protein JCM19047_1715 [Bacillus sp. JCM 19047]|nr:putative glycolipid-binding domain-containing protein [Shouchella miscanthi]GAF21987.1 hypothetical protein JCM19047_1715 [Bacillus sp. JCM 19047]